jgi:hypothetical protein
MATRIISQSFQRGNSVSTSDYLACANEGVLISLTFDVTSIFDSRNEGESIYYSNTTGQVYCSRKWVDEGFFVGENVEVKVIDSNNLPIITVPLTITAINGNNATIPNFPQASQAGIRYVIQTTEVNKDYGVLSCRFAHRLERGNLKSLATNEDNVFTYDFGTNSFDILSMSGEFFQNNSISKIVSPTPRNTRYIVSFLVFNPYHLIQDIVGSNQLKFFSQFKFSNGLFFDFNPSTTISGYGNNPENARNTAGRVQSSGTVYYDDVSVINYSFTGSATVQDVGLLFIPDNVNEITQSNGLAINNSINYPLYNTTFSKPSRDLDGADYSISFTSNTVTITPNSAFTDYFDARTANDRRIVVYVKIGNAVFLIHNKDAERKPKTTVVSTFNNSFYVHNKNYTNSWSNVAISNFIIGDDVAYFPKIRSKLGDFLRKATCRIFGTDGVNEWELYKQVVDLSFLPMNVNLQPFDIIQDVNNELPSGWDKRSLRIKSNGSVSSFHEIQVYFPFIVRWEEIGLPNIPNSPINGQNWYLLQNPLYDYFAEVLIEGTLNDYQAKKEITFDFYDSDSSIAWDIDFIDSNNITLADLPPNEVVTIKAKATFASSLITDGEWGQIAVQIKNNSQNRWIISTNEPHDFNVNNPLSPIVGNTASINVSTSGSDKIVEISCKINTNLISLSDEYKLTYRAGE